MTSIRYTEDRIIHQSTVAHPGPWVGKQRVYQTKADKERNVNWFHIRERIYDANHSEVSDDNFMVVSNLSGTKEWLMLGDDEPVLTVKKMFY